MATDDIKIHLLLSGTWPTSQYAKKPYLKLRLGGSTADFSACQTHKLAVPRSILALFTCLSSRVQILGHSC